MRRKSEKLRRNKAGCAKDDDATRLGAQRTAMREKSDASKRAAVDNSGGADTLAVPQSLLAMPGSDLQLARKLLDGFIEERHGTLRTKYLESGDFLELQARTAIARLLRSKGPLDAQLRWHLANLFDPAADWQRRKIEFVPRSRKKTDHVRNSHIASHIWDEVEDGGRVTAAVMSAAEKFALSDDMVKKIWGIYRPRMERAYGPLRRGRRDRR
jgi:hypothetical protein